MPATITRASSITIIATTLNGEKTEKRKTKNEKKQLIQWGRRTKRRWSKQRSRMKKNEGEGEEDDEHAKGTSTFAGAEQKRK